MCSTFQTCILHYSTFYNKLYSTLLTLWAIKKWSQLIFVCCFTKNQRILMQFPLLELTMNDTWRHELHPPHLISVATLPCESQNSKNVILQWNITKEIASNISYMLHRNGPLNYKSWGVMQQCVYETKICDIYDLQNAWRKLGLTSNRRLKWLLDNSRTCQLADCQLED